MFDGTPITTDNVVLKFSVQGNYLFATDDQLAILINPLIDKYEDRLFMQTGNKVQSSEVFISSYDSEHNTSQIELTIKVKSYQGWKADYPKEWRGDTVITYNRDNSMSIK